MPHSVNTSAILIFSPFCLAFRLNSVTGITESSSHVPLSLNPCASLSTAWTPFSSCSHADRDRFSVTRADAESSFGTLLHLFEDTKLLKVYWQTQACSTLIGQHSYLRPLHDHGLLCRHVAKGTGSISDHSSIHTMASWHVYHLFLLRSVRSHGSIHVSYKPFLQKHAGVDSSIAHSLPAARMRHDLQALKLSQGIEWHTEAIVLTPFVSFWVSFGMVSHACVCWGSV